MACPDLRTIALPISSPMDPSTFLGSVLIVQRNLKSFTVIVKAFQNHIPEHSGITDNFFKKRCRKHRFFSKEPNPSNTLEYVRIVGKNRQEVMLL